MKWVLRLLLLGFLLIPNIVAAVFFHQAGVQSQQAAFLKGDTPSGYAAKGPFLAEGNLVSLKGLTVKSLYQEIACVGYHTKVEQLQETYSEDSDGNERSHISRSKIFEQTRAVEDLAVEFSAGRAPFPLERVTTFYDTYVDELDQPPAFVPRSDVPNPGTGSIWYAVSEDVFMPGQRLFVAASSGPGQQLEEHPVMGQLLLYPGTRAECAEALASGSRWARVAAIALVVGSLVMSTILAIAIRIQGRARTG